MYKGFGKPPTFSSGYDTDTFLSSSRNTGGKYVYKLISQKI